MLVGVLAPACSSETSADIAEADGGSGQLGEGGIVTPGSDGSVEGDGARRDAATGDAAEGPSCTNKKKDGAESDVDCGGMCPSRCVLLQGCAVANDCTTGLACVKTVCASPAANDGMKNGKETDVDCGGNAAPPCEDSKDCLVGADCVEKVCDGTNKCAPAAVDDNVKNGKETDVDCGGGAPAPACITGKACLAGPDCASKVCTGNVCQAPTPTDGQQNGNETDVDCGGGAPAPACGTNKKCIDGPTDCVSFVCTGNVCQAATGIDGVKNGDESDTDCGGTTTGAPKCDPTFMCNAHADCKSDGCAFDGRCGVGKSCTKKLGGVTCGSGEVVGGEPGGAHESCCETVALTGSAVRLGKYHVTAGRMRAMIEREAGNVRAFAPGTSGWNAAWNDLVPSTVAEANTQLGSYWNGAPNDNNGAESKRSCQPNFFGGHTYYTPGAGEAGDYSQSQLDPKALNCVGWHIARAFCAWDGGRLPTRAEIVNAFTNAGAPANYPWSWQDASPYDQTTQDPRLNHKFNYGFPGTPRRVPATPTGTIQDITWHIAPPGRFPDGVNANGAQDMAGNLLHWHNDSEYHFTWTSSWENHNKNLGTTNWATGITNGQQPNGYYGIGFRCAYP